MKPGRHTVNVYRDGEQVAEGIFIEVEDLSPPGAKLREFTGVLYIENATALIMANAILEVEFEDSSRVRIFLTRPDATGEGGEFSIMT